MFRSPSFSLHRSTLSPSFLWSRIVTAAFILLAGLSFTEQAPAQCAQGIYAYTVCTSGGPVPEGGSRTISVSVRIQLGGSAPATFSISASSSTGTATPSGSTTVTIPAGARSSGSVSWTFSADDDSVYTGGGSFDVSASVTSGGGGSVTNTAVRITDDEPAPSISVTSDIASWSEGISSVPVTLTAKISEAIGKSLRITFSSSNTSDYTNDGPTTSTISRGSTSTTGSINFSPINDDVDEPDISVTVRARSNDRAIGSAFVTMTQRDNDTSEALSLSRTNVTVAEGATATYTVSLAEAPSGSVSVALSLSGDADIDASPTSLSFSTTNWSTGQTVTVEAGQDDDLANGSATISHVASGANYAGIKGSVTAIEEDDDIGSLVFLPSSVNVPEDGDATYSVSLSHQPSSNVTVAIAKKSGGDTDITVSPASLTFTSSNWSTGQTVTLKAASDSDGLNGTATIGHTASGAEYASVTGDVTATEQDTDRKLVTSTNLVTVDEGSSATYTVRLATQPIGTVTVAVSWLQGDADLSVTPPSLSFTTGNWNTPQTVTVEAAQDNDLADGSATFWHSASGGGYGGVTARVSATEKDDDEAGLLFSGTPVTVPEDDKATYTVRPRYAPTGTVSVSVAVANVGDTDITVNPASLTFTTSNWRTAQTVTVSARDDDDAVNGSRQITHTAAGGGYAGVTASVTATEQDDDEADLDLSKTALTVAEGGTATYTVELATQPTAAVTVSIVRSSGDTSISVNPPSMTFTTSNWDDAQVVTVSAAEDTDGTNGTATISHTASGGDYATVSADATATESDNDTRGITLSETAFTVEEGGSDTYTVRLATQPSASVTVSVSRSSGDSSITVTPSTLTFTTTTWSTPQTVTVEAAEDDDLADGTATIGHTATGGGYGSVTASVTVTEEDNDAAALVFSRTTLVITEEATATYTVSLLSQPSRQVTVAIAKVAGGDPDLSASPTPLTFTTANWNTAQTVTVSAADDDDLADGAATFRHTAAGGDYAAITRSLTATETDNDTGELDFSITALNVPEGGAATYTMRLKFQPTATVAVLLAHSTGDPDITVNPPAVVFTPSNWAVARTVTLTAASDNDLADGTATIGHTAIGGGYDGVTGDVTATEQDDDTGQLLFSKSSLTVPEGGSTSYTVTLGFQPTDTVTVSIADSGDDDISATTTSLSFTTVNWNSPQTVSIEATEDDDLSNGAATITHTASGGGYTGIATTLPATERDNDSGAFAFSMTALTAPEGGDTDYTVRLAYEPTSTVTVTLAATGDPDLTALPGSLTFTTVNWNTPQTVTVSAADDDDIAPGRGTVTHTAMDGGYNGVIESVTVTEEDDDEPGLLFSGTPVTVSEGGTATYTVRLEYQPISSLTVLILRASGDSDLTVDPSLLSFSTTDWNVAQTITVSAAEDDDLTNGATVFRHSALGGGYGSLAQDLTMTERDNDSAGIVFSGTPLRVPEAGTASYGLTLSHQPSGDVTIAPTVTGDTDISVLPATLTFTTSNWRVSQSFTASAAEDDDLANGIATISHSAQGGGYAGVTAAVVTTEEDNDRGTLVFSATEVEVPENSSAAYTVKLSAKPAAIVTVAIAKVTGGDPNLSASPSALTFTTSNWNASQTVTVRAAEDLDLSNGTATFRHTASGAEYAGVTDEVDATEQDNDTAGLVFSTTNVDVPEGGSATYTVKLSARPGAPVAVGIAPAGGADPSITAAPATLTFSTTNWNTAQTVTVRAAEDDDLVNGTATISHTAVGGGYDGVTGEVDATEQDNDTAGLVFSSTDVDVPEGGDATYTVRLGAEPSSSVTLTVTKTMDGDEDIMVSPPSLTFTTMNWSTAQTVTVEAAEDDDLVDGTATIEHDATGGGYNDVDEDIMATEQDNDSPGIVLSIEDLQVPEGESATYTVKLGAEPGGSVMVIIATVPGADDDLSASPTPLTFTTTTWNTAQTVTVEAEEDVDLADGTALFRHSVSSMNYAAEAVDMEATEDDNDTGELVLSRSALTVQEGSSATYTVELKFQPTGNVAVSVVNNDGDPDITTLPVLLSFTPSNWNTAQTVTVRAAEDDDGLNGTAPLLHTALGGGYDGVTGDVDATEDDNDSAFLFFSNTDLKVPEGGSATYTVSLATQPSSPVTLTVSKATGGDDDITVSPASLTFTTTNWNTAQTVTVEAAEDDDLVDGTATIEHDADGGGYDDVDEDIMATEQDDDSPGIVLSSENLQIPEGGKATYTVKLASQPSGSVTVTVTRSGDINLSVSPTPLTFTTSNWNTAQTVTVSAAQDVDIADGPAVITHTATGADYASVTAHLTATEDDDDTPELVLSRTNVQVSEGGDADYTVRLRWQPEDTVAVAVSRSQGDEDISVSPTLVNFTTTNWNTPQTLTLSAGQDDDLTDGIATIGHTAIGGGYDDVTGDVTATEVDDDTASLLFSDSSVMPTEGSSASYTVRLATQPSDPVTVAVTPAVGADPDLTAAPASLMFTTSNWNTAQEVEVTAGEDDDGINSTAAIEHTASGGDYAGISGQVQATEQDNDLIGLVLSDQRLEVREGLSLTWTVALKTMPASTVTVAIAPQSAADPDLTALPSSLTFTTTNWNKTQTVTVSAAQDEDVANGTATFLHTASGGDYDAVLGEVAVAEVDDDTGGLFFSPTQVEVPEGGEATYTLELAFQPTATVTVAVSPMTGGDPDLTATPALLMFTRDNWDTAQTVTVEAADDDDVAHGTAALIHRAIGGGYDGVTGQVEATEQDDDTVGLLFSRQSFFVLEGFSDTYTVRLATRPSQDVLVTLSAQLRADPDLTALPLSLSFTPNNWNTTQLITVSAAEDLDSLAGESMFLHTAGGGDYDGVSATVSVTESDNDAPGLVLSRLGFAVDEGESVDYTVSLATAPPTTVAVTVTPGPGADPDLTALPASLTFTTTNWNIPQPVTVSAAEDDDTSNGEAMFTHDASGGDYDDVSVSFTVTEFDNDRPALLLQPRDVDVLEGESATWTVALASEPSNTITVHIEPVSGADPDLTALSSSLTFTTANWNMAQTVTVEAREDGDSLAGEAVFLHTASGGDYDAVMGEVSVAEVDNDAPALMVSETMVEVAEDAGEASWTVVLTTEPSGPVTVSVFTGDSTIATVTPLSLPFGPTTWNIPQTVTVTAVNDFVDSDRTTEITHRASGEEYARVPEVSVEVALIDDDTAGVIVQPEELSMGEGDEAFYTLELATKPLRPVAIEITRLGDNVDNLSWTPTRLTFAAAGWNTPQRVALSVEPDEDPTPGVALLRHTAISPDSAYNGIGIDDVEVILGDDDQVVTSARLTLSDYKITEGEASALVTVLATLDAVTTTDLSINLSFGGTATAEDYSVGGVQVIEVEAGKQTGETVLTFAPVDDALVEGEETIQISGTAAGLTVTGAEIILQDNDTHVTTAKLGLSDKEITEGEASALVTVTATLDAVTSSGLSITLSFGGTATAEDYSVGGVQVIEVEAGKQTGETVLTFAPVDDALVEGEETIQISGTAAGLTVTGAEIILQDNDTQVTTAKLGLSDKEIAEGEASALVTVTATLDAVTSSGLSITLSFGGTATAEDYSVGGVQVIEVEAGKQTGETVLTFAPVDDALVEGEETIIVNGSSPGLTVSQATLTLLDDDFDPGDVTAELSVDIARVAESARDTLVSVTLTLENDFTFDEIRTFELTVRGSGEDAAVDFAPIQPRPINLLSNSSVAHTTFVLRPDNDLVDELDETLTLSVAASPLSVTPTTITLADDDAPPTGISLSVDDPDISEGEGPSEILVTARVEGGTTYAHATTLTLDLGGTATEGRGGDYTLSGSLVVTIPPGQALANTILSFTVIDDSRDELDETIDITATTPAGLPVTPTSLTLLDNDESLLTLRAEPRRLQEGAGSQTITLTVTVRSGNPYDEDLSVSLEFGGTAIRARDYSLSGPFTFSIPAGDLSASTSLTIIPVDDTLDEPDETLEIAGNAGVGYTSTAVVLIIDNDIPPARLHLTATPSTLAETAPPTRVLLEARVEGNTAFSTDTEIALAFEGTAIASVDYDVGGIKDPLILPAGRLSVTRELNITPIDDPHPEGTEQIVITGMTIVRILPATIALLDDDGADLTISFTHSEYTANEYGSPATVVVTVTPAADRREAIELTFSHLGGVTAEDYRGIPDELVFEPGEESRSFTVEALPDQAYESGERIRLRLDSPSTKVSFQPLATATVLLVEKRPTDDFSREARTVLALSSRAWSDSVQMALEERFARARQTEEWGNWQPDYQEPRNHHTHPQSHAFGRHRTGNADRIVPGDWLAAWRQKNERRNMGLIDPRFSLRKVLAKLKGWRPVLWAEGSTHHFSGQAQALDYQGAFQAAHVGLDLHSSKKTLIGASVMRGYSTMDYSDGQGLDGSTTATLYTIHPYLQYQAHDRLTVWTAGGIGFAPLTLRELDRDHDLSGSARMAAGGLRVLAKNWDRRELAIRTDTDIAWIGAPLPVDSVTLGGHAGRVRFLAELTQILRLYGQTLVATGEAGGRFHHGGAHRGAGAETAGRLTWRNTEKGLDFSAHGQTLLWQASGFRIWGAGVQASWDPGAEKRGLVLRFASGRGPRGGKTRLFHEPADRLFQSGDGLDTELELGYGTGVKDSLLTLTFRLRGVTGWTAAVDLR